MRVQVTGGASMGSDEVSEQSPAAAPSATEQQSKPALMPSPSKSSSSEVASAPLGPASGHLSTEPGDSPGYRKIVYRQTETLTDHTLNRTSTRTNEVEMHVPAQEATGVFSTIVRDVEHGKGSREVAQLGTQYGVQPNAPKALPSGGDATDSDKSRTDESE